MRSRTRFFAVTLLLCVNGNICHAQQQTGPATLESLLNSDERQKPATTDADAGPKRPAGTVARPKDGVHHPDLDKAWADYDAAIAKVAEDIRAAIDKQFDAATAKGDLEAASRWEASRKRFEQRGGLPQDNTTNSVVAATRSSVAKANAVLQRAYKELTETITKEKKISDALLFDDERKRLVAAMEEQGEQPAIDSISLLAAKATAERVLVMSEKEWEQIPGAVFRVPANPNTPCDTGVVLQKRDRHLFLPCPTDRWNSSPKKVPNTDFRGHDNKDRTANGMRFMCLCYSVANGPLKYVLETSNVNGLQGPLRFMPSDFAGGGDPNNNTGSVRVKIVPIR